MTCADPNCPPNYFNATRKWNNNDDECDTGGTGINFCVGSWWYDTVAGQMYKAVDVTCGSANWISIGGREAVTQFIGSLQMTTQVIPNNTVTTLAVSSVLNSNPADSWDAINYQLTVDKTGLYQVTSDFVAPSFGPSSPATGRIASMQVLVNSLFVSNTVLLTNEGIESGTITFGGQGASRILQINSGSTIEVAMFQNFGINMTLDDTADGGKRNTWSVFRICDFEPL